MAREQRVRVDRLPIGIGRLNVKIDDLFDKGRLFDGAEQACRICAAKLAASPPSEKKAGDATEIG